MSSAQVHSQENTYPWLKPFAQSICRHLNEGESAYDASVKATLDNMTDSMPQDVKDMKAKGIWARSLTKEIYLNCPETLSEVIKQEVEAQKEQKKERNIQD